MSNVLAKIVEHKRREVAALEQRFPLTEFKHLLGPSRKSFKQALTDRKAGFIFECKKASPSKGLIREPFDLDEIIPAYAKEAACFSVLTDEKYFQGHYDYLQKVSSSVSQPVLNKDFFINEYQIHLARYYHADAVLLMLSVLDDLQYKRLATLANAYHMDVLTEVSNEQECHRALALGATIIGINNRDLRDLSTDLARTEHLVPIIRQHKDFDGVIISESGIYHYRDLLRLNPLVDGYLVGSSLMAQADLSLAVDQLCYGQVKVCGITSLDQARLVSTFPVSYLGLIMVPESPRFVALETALEITQAISAQYVGVFKNQSLALVAQYAHKLGLFAVQLHGNEDSKFIEELRKLLPDHCKIWKVLSIDVDYQSAITIPDIDGVDAYLLDSKIGQQSGGTGQRFHWQALAQLNKEKLILAGGLSPDNIVEAAHTGASILDVNSGVESKVAHKSHDLLEQLFSALRA